MRTRRLLAKRISVALGAALCLIFGATAMPVIGAMHPAPANRAILVPAASRQLVLHGIEFDSKTGQLKEGSKAVLDDAAEILKSNPDTIVLVEGRTAESTSGCDLSAAETRTIESYMKERGVPGGRVMLCRNNPSFRVAAG